MKRVCRQLFFSINPRKQKGQGMLEYALVIAFVVVVGVVLTEVRPDFLASLTEVFNDAAGLFADEE